MHKGRKIKWVLHNERRWKVCKLRMDSCVAFSTVTLTYDWELLQFMHSVSFMRYNPCY